MLNVAGNVLPFPEPSTDILLDGPTPTPQFITPTPPAGATAVYMSTKQYMPASPGWVFGANGTIINATAAPATQPPPTTTVATTLYRTTTGQFEYVYYTSLSSS